MAEIYFPKPHPLSSTQRRRAYYGDDDRLYIKERGRVRLAKGVETYESIYYWWFEYLKRSDFYQKACKRPVELNSERKREYTAWRNSFGKRLLDDFGNIFDVEFWDWWTEKGEDGWTRGVRLFGINPSAQLLSFVSLDDLIGMRSQIDEGGYKLLAIPTNLSRQTIKKRIAKLVSEHELELNPTDEQKARYHPVSMKVDSESLRICLGAYDMKQSGKSNIEIGAYYVCSESQMRELIRDGRKKGKSYGMEALTRALKNTGYEEYEKMIESESDELAYLSDGKERTAKKNYLNVKASRMIKKARANIRAVEQGEFPLGH